jgi:hypothetical protein
VGVALNGHSKEQEDEMENLDLSQTHSEAGEIADVMHRLETYEDLNGQYRHYLSLLENAINHRQSVRPCIFEKVRGEYEEAKAKLEQERESLEKHLQANLDIFLQERDRINSTSQEERDRLEEIDFRIRVGEFTEEEMAEKRDTLKQNLMQYFEDLERMEEILQAYDRAGLGSSSSPERDPGPPEDDPEGSGEDDSDTPEEAFEPEAADWVTRGAEVPDHVSVEPSLPEPGPEKGQALAGDFQVVVEDDEPSDENCPVIECPDILPQSAPPANEGSPVGADAEHAPMAHAVSSCVSGYLIAMEGSSREGERFPLLCSNITLGTSPGSDIRLSDPGIKNFHAQIHFKGRKHYLENLDAMGCSFVNGTQGGLLELRDGDIIRLGDVKFQVQYSTVN